jgi:hypothetical protein
VHWLKLCDTLQREDQQQQPAIRQKDASMNRWARGMRMVLSQSIRTSANALHTPAVQALRLRGCTMLKILDGTRTCKGSVPVLFLSQTTGEQGSS